MDTYLPDTKNRARPGRGRITWAEAVLLALLVPLAVLPFGTVHEPARLLIAAIAAMVALWTLRDRALRPAVAVVVAVGLVVLFTQVAMLIPVGPSIRAALQPGLAPVVERSLATVGASSAPLALDPRGALVALAGTAAGLLVLVAATHGSRRGARWAAEIVVITAAATTGAALAQWSLGISGPYGTGIGDPDQPTFGPFANVNHGAALAAASVPLALALATRARSSTRWLALAATVLLLVGVWASGSRGATVIAFAGALAFAALAGSRSVRIGAGLTTGLVAAAVALAGPTRALDALTRALDPSHAPDLYTNRPAMWSDALGLLGAAPWLGVGGGGFDEGFAAVKTTPKFMIAAHAHQDALELAATHGLPVALLVIGTALGLLAVAAARALRLAQGEHRTWIAAWCATALALLLFSTWDFPLAIGALGLLLALAIGTTLGLAYPSRRVPTADLQAEAAGFVPSTGVRASAAARAGTFAIGALTLGLVALTLLHTDPDERIATGQAALDALDAPGAAEAYAEALASRPLSSSALLGLAHARHRMADREGAVAALEAASQVHPTLPWIWLDLARLHRMNGDPEAARAAYRRLLALDAPEGGTAAPWIREALLAGADVVAVADEVLADRPDRLCTAGAVVSNMSRANARLAAETLFWRAIAVDPPCAVEFATRLHIWGRNDEALVLLEPLPEQCGVLRVRGAALVGLARYDEALPVLEQAMSACGPEDTTLRLNLARARLGTGDRSGIGILESLVADNPELYSARRSLWRALDDRGRQDQAVVQLEALVQAGVATEEEQAALERLVTFGKPSRVFAPPNIRR